MVPLAHDSSVSCKVLVHIRGLPAAAAEPFLGSGGIWGVGGGSAGAAALPRSCPSAVQVSQDVIVDFSGDLLLLQHLLNSFTSC